MALYLFKVLLYVRKKKVNHWATTTLTTPYFLEIQQVKKKLEFNPTSTNISKRIKPRLMTPWLSNSNNYTNEHRV